MFNVLYNPVIQGRVATPDGTETLDLTPGTEAPPCAVSSWSNLKFSVVSWCKTRGYHLVDAFGIESYDYAEGSPLTQVTLSTGKKLTCHPDSVIPLLRHKTLDPRVEEGCIRAKDLKSGDSLIGCSFDDLTKSNAVEVKVVKVKPKSADAKGCLVSFSTQDRVPVGVAGVLLYPY